MQLNRNNLSTAVFLIGLFSLIIVLAFTAATVHLASPPQEEDARMNDDERAIKNMYDYHLLPEGFVIEQRLGDGWIVFSLKGNKYLYRRHGSRDHATEVLAPFVE